MEQRLQPLLSVVVAELLKRGASLLLSEPRVLETRSVDDEQRTQRVLTGLQSPAGQRRSLKLFAAFIVQTLSVSPFVKFAFVGYIVCLFLFLVHL